MRFEVPQFIEIEDKIIGPLTWKQFIYLAGGFGVMVVSYLSFSFSVFVFIAIPTLTLSGFLAFHRVHNRPFSVFLESLVQYFTGVKLYLWKRTSTRIYRGRAAETVVKTPHTPPTSKQNISSLSRQLELSALIEEQK